MEILVFEWFTGGGLLQDAEASGLDRSIVQEGLAMASSICTDLVQVGHVVHLPVDYRIPGQWLAETGARRHSIQEFERLPDTLRKLAKQSGAIIVIAPECEGRLILALDWLADFEERMVSPFGDIVRIGSSKLKTSQWLESHRVQRPFEIDPAHPVVLKPDDGAGSDRVQLFQTFDSIQPTVRDNPANWRMERLLNGLSVSLSAIGGPNGIFLFPPTIQIFESRNSTNSIDSTSLNPSWPGTWTGFDFPLDGALAERAAALCERALKSLPEFSGYIGMDLIIADDGADEDRIVDLNPRMTTSWVGLRQMYSSNLGEFMIDHARGVECQLPVLKSTELMYRLPRK